MSVAGRVVLALTLAVSPAAAFAQQGAKPGGRTQAAPARPAPAETEEARRERINANTIGLDTGQIEGLYPRFGAEIAKVLDGPDMRILPILAYGAASNIEDLLYLKGVDVAFTQSDALEHFRRTKNIPNLQNRVHYAARLYATEVHILARADIRTVKDLEGQNVSFGPVGNSAHVTGPIAFDRLGVKVETLTLDHATGLQRLRSGEIAALVRVIGKPLDYFSSIPAGSGLHFLPLAGTGLFDDIYSLGELTSKDYPNLIPQGERVDTISVPTVLAVYNWGKDSERGRRVDRFIEALLTKWDAFHSPAFHPKWRDINPAARVPGWTRAPAADRVIQRQTTQQVEAVSRSAGQ